MRLVILLFLIFWYGVGTAQVVFQQTTFDMGTLDGTNKRFVDVKLTNNSSEDAFILSVKKPKGVIYIKQSAFISPGQSTFIRFQVNASNNGKFNYKIPVYTSDKSAPTIIQLKGEVAASQTNQRSNPNLTACPTFGQHPPIAEQTSFQLTIKTIDKTTGKELGKSMLGISAGRRRVARFKTNKKGVFVTKIPLGIYYFQAAHPGYFPTVKRQYVNFNNNLVILELEPKKPIQTEPETTDTLLADNNKTKETVSDEERIITLPPVSSPPLTDTVKPPAIQPESPSLTPKHPALADLDSTVFTAEYFQPINVVFVIDISGSMRNFDRIDLLKESLEELTKMLRPEDQIGVVSYANEAEVLIRPTSGGKKEKIIKKVKAIRPSGRTAGGAGIKLGYKEIRKNKIKGGTNHLIIITDGAFNLGSDDYKQYIKENLQKDVTMSVVGIKCNKSSQENMLETAQMGDGRLILIDNSADAEKLKQEIRLVAFRY